MLHKDFWITQEITHSLQGTVRIQGYSWRKESTEKMCCFCLLIKRADWEVTPRGITQAAFTIGHGFSTSIQKEIARNIYFRSPRVLYPILRFLQLVPNGIAKHRNLILKEGKTFLSLASLSNSMKMQKTEK